MSAVVLQELKQSPAETLAVRVGTPADMHDCMTLALSACEENGFLDPSPPKLAQEMWSALNLHYGIVGIVGQPTGAPEGLILLRLGQMWYSDAIVVEEKAIFVHPEFRSAKGNRAQRLAEFGKQVADKFKVPLMIGVLSNHRTKGKVRMYTRIFGEPAGGFWLYGARTGAHHGA